MKNLLFGFILLFLSCSPDSSVTLEMPTIEDPTNLNVSSIEFKLRLISSGSKEVSCYFQDNLLYSYIEDKDIYELNITGGNNLRFNLDPFEGIHYTIYQKDDTSQGWWELSGDYILNNSNNSTQVVLDYE